MSKEMDTEGLSQYATDNPHRNLVLERQGIEGEMYRVFQLDEAELRRWRIIGDNMDQFRYRGEVYMNFAQSVTGIPASTIDHLRLNVDLLSVVPPITEVQFSDAFAKIEHVRQQRPHPVGK